MNKTKNYTFYILINFREKKGEKYGPDFEKKPGKDRNRDYGPAERAVRCLS